MNVLVTGGTSGIGKAIVELLSLSNHNVVFSGRDQQRGADVEQMSGASFVRADLSLVSDCERLVEEYFAMYDTCDVLINNAGLWSEGKLVDTSIDEIEKVFAINAVAPIVLTKLVVEKMLAVKEPQAARRIIFVNSIAGLNSKAEREVYSSSKWAITGFARGLTAELAPEGIGVTNLCPGAVATELFNHGGYPRDTSDMMDPDAVAQAVEYIISLPSSVVINEMLIKPTSYI
jgi:short-subunit dehydrogenase